jgi:hypothetical protein
MGIPPAQAKTATVLAGMRPIDVVTVAAKSSIQQANIRE